MKKTIMLLALVAGAGYYLHWYTFSTETVGKTQHVHVIIDKEKIKQDEERALEKLRGVQGDFENRVEEEARQRVSAGFEDAGQLPPVRVVEQPDGYAPRNGYPQQGYPPQGAYPPGNYGPQGAVAPQADPYADPQTYEPPRRRPVRTAAQDLNRGFQ